MKPKRVWVVLNPAWRIAQLYGDAFTRKALRYEFERQGRKMYPGMKIVPAIIELATLSTVAASDSAPPGEPQQGDSWRDEPTIYGPLVMKPPPQ